MTREPLTGPQVADALRNLSQWTGDPSAIHRVVTCGSFTAAITLVDEVARIAEELDHHPDIDIRYDTVTFLSTTHSAGGVTAYDVELARRIDAAVTLAGC
jgi:4a-hydroxytetrahydrobiopterin dehydratase